MITNVSSIIGKRGMPFETDYCASKFALAGFSEALRAEVRSDEVDVNTIFRGAVEMEIIESAANKSALSCPVPSRRLRRANWRYCARRALSRAGIVDGAQPAG